MPRPAAWFLSIRFPHQNTLYIFISLHKYHLFRQQVDVPRVFHLSITSLTHFWFSPSITVAGKGCLLLTPDEVAVKKRSMSYM